MATFGSFTAGQVLTAAELNAAGTWTSFTPTWTNLTVGNATQSWKYSIFNKIMFIRGEIALGTTSAMGSGPSFTLPASKTAVGSAYGTALLFDQGNTGANSGTCEISGTACYIFSAYTGGTWGTRGGITATAPFTWGNTDGIYISIFCEIS